MHDTFENFAEAFVLNRMVCGSFFVSKAKSMLSCYSTLLSPVNTSVSLALHCFVCVFQDFSM